MTPEYNGLEVAIIGMAGRFPGARDVAEFWRNLRDGVESFRFLSEEELKAVGVDASVFSRSDYVRGSCVLDDIEMFDASFFDYTPREAQLIDPQQRLFLECAWEALENSGYGADTGGKLTGIYAGAAMNQYLYNNVYANPAVANTLGPLQVAIGNDKDFLTTRVSYKLNLEGPSVVAQTACSTSLVAVHLACQGLLSGECDLALAGAISLRVPQMAGYLYQEGGILSADGHCRSFDAKAQGTVGGSGTGIVVLKRLADALNDGDCIHAVIRGSAINNDGSFKLGYTAPRLEGQSKVIRAAQLIAGVEPESISFIEGHGSGTILGDPIEVDALTQVFRAGTSKKGFCALGSVKTNIGHLNTASGIAGLIKAVLALTHEQIPPSLHFEEPNPRIDFANSPFYVNTELQEWKRNGQPRRAGVSSFGIGGTNAHLILEEAPERSASGPSRPWQVLLLSAKTAPALEQMTTNVAAHLRERPEEKLADVAYTLALGRRGFAHRRMLVCESAVDAAEALETRDPRRVLSSVQQESTAPIAFMFSGVGDHYVNMGLELYRAEPVFRQHVDECCEMLEPHLGLDLREVLYPKGDQTPAAAPSVQPQMDLRRLMSATAEPLDEAGQRLNQTALTQPAIFVIDYALARLWMSWGVVPDALIGHSLGEYVAACLAGVFSLADALRLVANRAQMINELPNGVMLAVSLPEADVTPLLGEDLSLAAINTASLCVVAGPAAAVSRLEEQLTTRGVVFRRLQTSHAFHSHMMEPLRESFTRLVASIELKSPTKPYVSNVTGKFITSEQATDPHYWAQHLCEPVRFAEGLETLLGRAGRILLEVGPGQALSSHAWQYAELKSDQLVLSSMGAREEGQREEAVVLRTLGRLWLKGVGVDWSGYYGSEQRGRVPLPSYPFERQRCWIEAPGAREAEEAKAGSGEAWERESERGELADWFYRPVWKQAEARPRFEVRAEARQRWLIFADECGVGEALVGRLRELGQEVIKVRRGSEFRRVGEQSYEVNAGEAGDYERLLSAVAEAGESCGRIIHLWGVSRESERCWSEEQVKETQELGFYSLLWLGQALGKAVSAGVELLVVTNQMQQVNGDEEVVAAKATVLGPCRVLLQEYANVRCRSVDVGSGDGERLSAQLLSEFSGGLQGEKVVAYRGVQRWVQDYEVRRLEEVSNEGWLREQGVYLITGGMGGIGQEIAGYLARRVKARLVLVGRRGLDEAGARRVQQLEELGAEVLVLQADVTAREQLREVLRQSRARFGKLQGVIHTAGIAGGGLMQFKTKEQAAAVLGAKVTGTMLLAELLAEAEEQLDFMMLCSSMTAVLGGVGQADYCGANAFLDAFAQSESGQGRRTVAINWDAWREVGMAAQGGLAVGGGQTTNMFELQLRVGLESEQGVEAFHRIMGGTRLPQVLVSRRELQSAIKAADEWRDSSLLEDIEKHYDSTVQSHGRPQLQTPYVPPQDETQMTLCGIFQDLLGIDQIGIYDNFFELGGDSLVAIQLTNRLRKAFGLELRTINLFKAATVAELSEEMRKDSAADSLDQSSAIARAPREIQRIQRSASNELVFQAAD